MELVCQRMEVASNICRELALMSSISYPHGEPPLDLMNDLVSKSDWDFLEDKLLDIIFHSKEYEHFSLKANNFSF